MPILFSIIIPTYNSAATILRSLDSIYIDNANLPEYEFELLICDDNSKDNTAHIISTYIDQKSNIKFLQNFENSGPGIARNRCIEEAKGDWLIFLDSDDIYEKNSLVYLKEIIINNLSSAVDLILFNQTVNGYMDKDSLIVDYLKLQSDGSVIFSCVKRSLVDDKKIVFYEGFHEDVDFQFKLIFYSRAIYYTTKKVYKKINRNGSIVNSISIAHIDGFFRAWIEIFDLISNLHLNYYRIGFVGLIATRIRSILSYSNSLDMLVILDHLYSKSYKLINIIDLDLNVSQTKYFKIARLFLNGWNNVKSENLKLIEKIIMEKNYKWSCKDLQKSIYLGPNELRACCKRFFVDSKMKGDVVLLRSDNSDISSISVVKAKSDLLSKINSGNDCECTGCPYLEYKEWKDINQEKLDYISIEHHSICNLKCTYCSDTYYGGLKPTYSSINLIKAFVSENKIESDATIVWGGGEPTALKSFNSDIHEVIKILPASNNRVLSNSVKYDRTVNDLLDSNQITLTTSIDAGTKKTFFEVRGQDKLSNVINNLVRYSTINPRGLTIKYIFTEKNISIDEVKNFSKIIKDNSLQGCNFQISSNFKDEYISEEFLFSIVSLYSCLNEINVKVIFMDDLIANRLSNLTENELIKIKQFLELYNLADPIADSKKYPKVNIWGAGWNSQFLIQKTNFFKNSSINNIVDDTEDKIGSIFLGFEIKPSSELLNDNFPIVISAIQGFPIIYQKALTAGIDEERIVTKLII